MAVTDQPPSTERRPGLGRGTRFAIGLWSGIGATGIWGGISLLATRIDVDVPMIDATALTSLVALLAVACIAGAVLRGPAAIAGVVVGAAATPFAVGILIDGSCEGTMWLALGLMVSAGYAFVLTGSAAWIGDRLGAAGVVSRHRDRATWVLVALGLIGVVPWVVFLISVPGCP